MSFGKEGGFSLNLEPRKVFLNFLIITLKRIEFAMYFDGQVTAQIKPMMGLIDSLDRESQKKLAPQRERLQAFCGNVSLVTREEMFKIFSTILQYLHDTYLKEVRFARPRYPEKTKLEVPK